MKISFIGDIMPARFVGHKYNKSAYQIVSSSVSETLKNTEYVVANLESPVVDSAESDGHHLSFRAHPDILNEFDFIDLFSLSNNHINDCGTLGMDETVLSLNKRKVSWNGLFEDEYLPYIIGKDDQKYAIFTCTSIMNHKFENGCHWKVLKVGDSYLDELIKKYKNDGYFIFLYAHVGMLFTRFPSPYDRNILHRKIDNGVDIIVTAHSHVLGGMEYYKGKPIFYSIGDFLMDGHSYRRRRAAILEIEIENSMFKAWNIKPTFTNKELETVFPSSSVKRKMLRSWDHVTSILGKNKHEYPQEFKKLYKKEMLRHTLSTLKFLIDTKGLIGMIKLLRIRAKDVGNMKRSITSG